MATSRSLGSLTLDLIANIGGFSSALDKASRNTDKSLTGIEKQFSDFGDKIGDIFKNIAGAFGIGLGLEKFVDSIKDSIDKMDELSKGAQKVGLTTESFSGLTYAADLADVSIGDLESSLGKLTKSLGAALDKNSQQAKIFKALGISVTDASGKIRSSDDVLKDFADKFELLGGSQEAINAGFALFGKSFQNIIPLIKDGGDAISGLQQEAKDLNQVISTETGQAAEEFNDNLTRAKKAVDGIYNSIAAKLLPTLEDWSSDLVDLAKDNSKLDDIATGVADTLQALAAIGHTVAAAFKFIAAGIQTVAVAAGEFADVKAATDAISIFSPKSASDAADKISRINGAAADSIKDIWSSAGESISDSFDEAGKNIGRITGEVVDVNKRQLKKGADDFITSVLGTDTDNQAKADKITASLHGVLSNADRDAKEAKKSADELAAAYASLNEAVQKVDESTDPSQQAYNKYADTIRKIDQLGAAAISKGGDVAYVQSQVAKAVGDANTVLARDLAAPMKAAADYADALNAQLVARKQQIDLQSQSIGLGDKEASRLQELASLTTQGTKAISDFEKQYQDSVAKGKPNATEEQYDSELKALQDYWANVTKATKDGYAAVDTAQSDFLAGATKSTQNFIDQQKNLSAISGQLVSSFLDEGSDAFADFLDGTKSAQDALTGFIDSAEQEITKAVSKQLFKQLLQSFGLDSSSPSGSGSGIGSFISNLFSSGSTDYSAGNFGFANGGTTPSRSISRVNERGPELLTVGGKDYLMMGDQSGRVTPNEKIGMSSPGNVNNFYLAAPTSMKTQTQIANKTAYEIRRASRLA